MENVYIVVKTCGGNTDATAYKTRESAVKAVEELSGRDVPEWEFDDGTIYEGDNNYETVAQIIKSEVY